MSCIWGTSVYSIARRSTEWRCSLSAMLASYAQWQLAAYLWFKVELYTVHVVLSFNVLCTFFFYIVTYILFIFFTFLRTFYVHNVNFTTHKKSASVINLTNLHKWKRWVKRGSKIIQKQDAVSADMLLLWACLLSCAKVMLGASVNYDQQNGCFFLYHLSYAETSLAFSVPWRDSVE